MIVFVITKNGKPQGAEIRDPETAAQTAEMLQDLFPDLIIGVEQVESAWSEFAELISC